MGSVPTTTTQSSSGGRVKCLNDSDKTVLISNFKRRGWVKGSSEGEGECYTREVLSADRKFGCHSNIPSTPRE